MNMRLIAPVALFLLAGCSGNPLGNVEAAAPVEPAPPAGDLGEDIVAVGVQVPAILAQNLTAAVYNPTAQTLSINLASLDGTPVLADYTRDASLDWNGYEAYTIQETTTQRKFVALFKRSGGAQAGVVADGGQFANYFGGGTYVQVDQFTMPTSGLASYTGSYVGLLNTGAEVPGGLGGAFSARQSYRTEGTILLNADFNASNMQVNGAITDRRIIETDTPLDDIFLWVTGISADGAFAGLAKRTPETTMGNYGGVFGGVNASDVAGVLVVNPIESESALREHGTFAIPKCTGPSIAPCP